MALFMALLPANDISGVCLDNEILLTLPSIDLGSSSIRGKCTNHWAKRPSSITQTYLNIDVWIINKGKIAD